MDFLKDREKKYWFKSRERSELSIQGPLTEDKIRKLSHIKGDSKWMAEFRLNAFRFFKKLPMPAFGPDLSEIDFDDVVYYSKPSDKARTWEDIPADIKNTFERLGISEAEMKLLSGIELQYDSEVVFEKAKKELGKYGVIYLTMDDAVKKYPDLVKRYLGKVVPVVDNKFSALNSAVWSGGTFIYVPEGVKVPFPLHTYFRINLEGFGQFERTLIVAEPGAELTYVEGCTAPLYSKATLHAAVVEIVAERKSRVKYITLQNWSKNVYNLVTKRAFAYENAFVQWIDGNFGSKVTMKYPAVYLREEGAKGELISVAVATQNQNIDSGARMIHLAPNTHSNTVSKTISMEGGISNFRGTFRAHPRAKYSKIQIDCDSLISGKSVANAEPKIDALSETASINHEAKITRLDEDKLFYLLSRGMSRKEATSMVLFGFMRDFVKELPFEYAVELQRLIEVEIGGHSSGE